MRGPWYLMRDACCGMRDDDKGVMMMIMTVAMARTTSMVTVRMTMTMTDDEVTISESSALKNCDG